MEIVKQWLVLKGQIFLLENNVYMKFIPGEMLPYKLITQEEARKYIAEAKEIWKRKNY